MKKSIIASALAMVMLLSGCSGNNQESANSKISEISSVSSVVEQSVKSSLEENSKVSSQQIEDKIEQPLPITPQNVSDTDLFLAKRSVVSLFNSFDEMMTANETDKKIAQGALNVTVCFLDKRDGTDYFTTTSTTVNDVLLKNNDDEVFVDLVKKIYDTLVKSNLSFSGSRYSTVKSLLSAMKSEYSVSDISGRTAARLDENTNWSLLAVDCFYLSEFIISDTKRAGASAMVSSVSDSIIKSVEESRDKTTIKLAKLAFGIKADNDDISDIEKNIGFLFEMGGTVKSDTQITNDTSSSVEPSNDEISISAVKTLDGKICAFITNKGTTTIDELEVQIQYKDSSGTIIDLDDDDHDIVLPNTTIVSRFDAPSSYDTFDIEYTPEYKNNNMYQNHMEECEIKSNLGENCVIVQVTNNSNVEIDEFEYIIVYYKGSDIANVSYPEDIYHIAPGKTVVSKKQFYKIDFDRFEVYVNQAHTFH